MPTVSGSASTTTRNPRHWQLAVLVIAILPEIPTGLGHRARSFNHLVGAGEQAIGHGEAKRLRGLEVNDEFVPGRRLHREIGWFLALEDAIDVAGGAPELIKEIGSITDQTAQLAVQAVVVDGGQSVSGGQRDDHIALCS